MFLKTVRRPFFRVWELALLFSLCLTLLTGLWAGREQRALAAGLIRLHVIAASDSAADQAVKLRVRDAVLELLTPALADAATPEEARERTEALLPALRETAERVSGGAARAALGWEDYPTRHYDGFSLPAGRYLSLRLSLGAAQGRNWWCVVFPPLCTACAEDREAFASLVGEKDAALLRGEGRAVVLKFRVLELWQLLRARWSPLPPAENASAAQE